MRTAGLKSRHLALISRSALSPSWRGISISSVMRSGLRARAFSTPSIPSRAVPTTLNAGSEAIISEIIFRINAESSTTNTRTVRPFAGVNRIRLSGVIGRIVRVLHPGCEVAQKYGLLDGDWVILCKNTNSTGVFRCCLAFSSFECPREDSNLHSLARTTTSRWRVYQFRHLGRYSEGEYMRELLGVDPWGHGKGKGWVESLWLSSALCDWGR
jgi:hypothetical protein